MINYFVFDGESSLDYGVYIGGQDTFNAPQRDITKVSVPGRNGDLIQDNGRFLNVQVPYTIVVMDEFRDKTDAIKAWLLSKKTYVRLEDTYHPGTYRMARVIGPIDFETAAYNLTGKTKVIFDCKPQRFLIDGEEEFDIGSWGDVETQTGDMVSFDYLNDHGAFKKFEAKISPTQNLNGYAYPWPPGGGGNIFDYDAWSGIGLMRGEAVFENNGITITATGSDCYTLYTNNDFPQNARVVVTEGETVTLSWEENTNKEGRIYIFPNGENVDAVNVLNNVAKKLSYTPASGVNYITFRFGVSNLGDTIAYRNIQVTRGESVPVYTPYSNICPITGQTGASVYRTGRNLFVAGGTPGGSSTSNGITFTYNADGTITLNGRNNGSNMSVSTHMTNFRLPPGTYKKPVFRNGVGVYVRRIVPNSSWETVSGGDISYSTFTITELDAKYDLSVRIGIRSGLDFDFDNFVCEPYIYKNGEPLTYENPNYIRYPISWQTEAGTVYGGTVDFVSGVLTVDRATITFNGNETWYLSGSGTSCNYRAFRDVIVHPPNNQTVANILSDYFEPKTDDETSQGQIGISVYTGGYIRICQTGKAITVEGFKEWLSQNNVQVVYELATPLTYQLTANQIRTLLGETNAWADCGAVTVEYGDDPGLMVNPTRFESCPFIHIEGNGAGTLTMGSDVISVSAGLNEYVDIDCEKKLIYKDSVPKGDIVTLPGHRFPVLSAGNTSVRFSGGITRVAMKGNWWTV